MKKTKNSKIYKLRTDFWSVERGVFLGVGILIVVAGLVGLFYWEAMLYFIVFVGAMLVNFALTGICPMSIILDKLGFKACCRR